MCLRARMPFLVLSWGRRKSKLKHLALGCMLVFSYWALLKRNGFGAINVPLFM